MPESPAGDDPHADWRLIYQLLPHLKDFPGRILLALGCLIVAKLSGVALPMLLKHIVDGLDQSKHTIVIVPLSLLLAYGFARFVNVLMSELRDVVFGRVAERAMRRGALQVFRHLHALDLDFHLSRRTGGLSRDIERGVAGISFLLRFSLFNIIPTVLELALVAAILLVEYGWVFAVITAVAVLLYVAFSITVTEWRTQFVRKANQLDSKANTRAIDSLLNYETVKYFGNEAHEAAEYDRFLSDWEQAQQQNRLSLGALNVGQSLIVAGSLTAMMVIAAQGVARGGMTLGDFVAINAYVVQLFIPLNFLGFVYREIRRALTDMGRMFGLLDVQPKVRDQAQAKTLRPGSAQVRFEHVGFGYSPQRPILKDVSFEIPAGQTVAVVGASGAGKSTLARLLFRFYDPGQGRVTIDGQDLREVTQQSLRSAIAVVPQDTVLFNDTLLYNLQYGRPEATREEVEQAVRLAHLDGFIRQLPDGYATLVGERGLKLSGGEKQRVAIARALLKNPAILIFDEATSSLDSASERAILAAIEEVAAQRTTLVIAHRLSTIVHADQIVVLEQGRVIERGRHDDLLAANGAYAALWRLQQRQQLA
ncbi:ABC transporter related protein [Hydrocarboniphaga effusa AP103]|uniref:ABC transporter related protein n=1 Tax=Hydrocarboniphaga effusa AP103 TaxID=1172194 RepID=I8T4R2_9GAMM|nr:ABC transporter related protein [Hydrocarboniphaga effusa AP103]